MWRPFFLENMDDKDNEELRPSKMRGVAFPKAKYGVILAVIVIILVNLITCFVIIANIIHKW